MHEPGDENEEMQPSQLGVDGNNIVDVSAEVEEMIRYQEEDETTSQFQ